MAVINQQSEKIAVGVIKTLWETITGGDTGLQEQLAQYPDKTVQAIGTFSTNTLTMQGSNEEIPTTWFTLIDPQGAAITFTADGSAIIADNPRHIRPSLNGTGGDVDVIIIARG